MADITRIYPSDKNALTKITNLLHAEGIRLDKNLDYTCAIYDDNYENIIATGSAFKNTLRCFAVESKHQGEGLLNTIITHLMEIQHERGNNHFFLYAKCKSARFFYDLGFYEIARVEDEVVFMENQRRRFRKYLQNLQAETPSEALNEHKKIGAIVMNANPFTKGHEYLIETARKECDFLHVFIVSEDASLVPFTVRKKLLIENTKSFANVIIHESGSYIISSATFPSYFQKDEASVSRGHALLDIEVFKQIAKTLNINTRYVGEEPFSDVTNIYNQTMLNAFKQTDIQLKIIPRKEFNREFISASKVRKLIHEGNILAIEPLVPVKTFNYFQSQNSAEVRRKIMEAENIIHH